MISTRPDVRSETAEPIVPQELQTDFDEDGLDHLYKEQCGEHAPPQPRDLVDLRQGVGGERERGKHGQHQEEQVAPDVQDHEQDGEDRGGNRD